MDIEIRLFCFDDSKVPQKLVNCSTVSSVGECTNCGSFSHVLLTIISSNVVTDSTYSSLAPAHLTYERKKKMRKVFQRVAHPPNPHPNGEKV